MRSLFSRFGRWWYRKSLLQIMRNCALAGCGTALILPGAGPLAVQGPRSARGRPAPEAARLRGCVGTRRVAASCVAPGRAARALAPYERAPPPADASPRLRAQQRIQSPRAARGAGRYALHLAHAEDVITRPLTGLLTASTQAPRLIVATPEVAADVRGVIRQSAARGGCVSSQRRRSHALSPDGAPPIWTRSRISARAAGTFGSAVSTFSAGKARHLPDGLARLPRPRPSAHMYRNACTTRRSSTRCRPLKHSRSSSDRRPCAFTALCRRRPCHARARLWCTPADPAPFGLVLPRPACGGRSCERHRGRGGAGQGRARRRDSPSR